MIPYPILPKPLSALLPGVNVRQLIGDAEVPVRTFFANSAYVEPGDMFVAVRGVRHDAHGFIPDVITRGAVVVVCETLPETLTPAVTYVQVAHSTTALAAISANYYEHPARRLTIAGVTGTNGKTSTATMLHRLFRHMGLRAGLLSTIRNVVVDTPYAATHTTPEARSLHGFFAMMAAQGCGHCFMEVSSHSLDLHRVDGVPFSLAMFTNLTHDHLDYHKTFAAYRDTKKRLFDGLAPGSVALVNADDRNARYMTQNCAATIRTYGLQGRTDYEARILENTFEGLHLNIGRSGQRQDVWFRLLGEFNAYNLLLTFAAAVELGLDAGDVLQALSELNGVEGRFETLRAPNGVMAIVDYAHTPDALQKILATVQDINRGRHEVYVVIGCGGNRDREKRPEMGRIAAEGAQHVILTSDNPRDEDPQQILQEMQGGLPAGLRRAVLTIPDRAEAIQTACAMARPGDIVIVAGKGHETYQEIAGVQHHFDDREVVRAALWMG